MEGLGLGPKLLKGGYPADYGNYYTVIKGDARSLEYSST